MKKSQKMMEIKLERTIQATPEEAYKAWLNPKVPGTPWNEANKLILNPKVNGFFYWLFDVTPHYGRFTEMKKAKTIQYTWMSPYTQGIESIVTVTFKKTGKDTLMTLTHSNLPDNEVGWEHEGGWIHFLDKFPKHFENLSKKIKK